MGKYGNLIQQAKADTGKPESQEAREPDSQKTRRPANQKARKPENQKARRLEIPTDEEMVNLGVKVPLSLRRHWAAESKRTGVSMTEVIIKALTKEFGKPE
ncbi:MAG TPA: hypothetical protein VIC84_04895 [Blastocatellia bacterium]|jgi:hypothetical protein